MNNTHIEDLIAKYREAGQEHVFSGWEQLTGAQQKTLVQQAAQIDLGELNQLVEDLVAQGQPADWGDIHPAEYIPQPHSHADQAKWDAARALGEKAIRAGRVAVFTPAGGQGSRLGFEGPKGTFPVTPIQKLSLFQLFAEKILAASRRYEVAIPWYIMTSEENHQQTVSFFEDHAYFGLGQDLVKHFIQGTMPVVDFSGKIMMADKGQMVTAPDGHGGSFRALVRSGSIEDMKKRGHDIVSFFQVDNPLVKCIDPEFIGFHLQAESEFSSKACIKAYAEEKMGVFVTLNGKTQLVEYSDLPEQLTHAKDADGGILYRAGSMGIHIVTTELIDRIGSNREAECRLPFHRATKKIPSKNASGQWVFPDKANGIKFEMFGFDAIPFAKHAIIIEASRPIEFSPVKNADGADSPATAREAQLELFRSWARANGNALPSEKVEFEISPLFADSKEAFIARGYKKPITQGLVLDEP